MGLVSLLETGRLKAEGKRIGVFTCGSGCGALIPLCSRPAYRSQRQVSACIGQGQSTSGDGSDANPSVS